MVQALFSKLWFKNRVHIYGYNLNFGARRRENFEG
jgi:hypothetical protein